MSARTHENGHDGAVRLHPAEVDAIARRLLELLRSEGAMVAPPERETPLGDQTSALVTAAEIARRFGLRREWVYGHADRLGAVRLGDGPRPRLRFDPERVMEVLRVNVTAPSPTTPSPGAIAPRRRSAPIAVGLLPIRRGGSSVGDDKKVAGARVNAPGRGTGAMDSDAARTLPVQGRESPSADRPASVASTDRRTHNG
jgi:hypothetical protein